MSAQSKYGTHLAVIVVVMFLAVLFFWWYTLQDYRTMTADVRKLRADMATMQQHVTESAKLLEALSSLKQEVVNARAQSDAALEDSCRLVGDERIDYLTRLLETDLARRCGVDSANGSAGAVPGAGGVAGGSGTAPRASH